MKVYRPKRKGKDEKVYQYPDWYVRIKDHEGRDLNFKGFPNKRSTEEFGRKLEKLVLYRKAGEAPPPDMKDWALNLPEKTRRKLAERDIILSLVLESRKTILEQLADYIAVLRGRQGSEHHVRQVESRIRRILREGKFVTFSQLTKADVEKVLARLTEGPNALSNETRNHHQRSLSGFLNWLMSVNRIDHVATKGIPLLNAKRNRRRVRRPLRTDEIRRLLSAALHGKTHHRLTGYQRYLVYLIAMETGYRWGEIHSLTPANFSLEEQVPFVCLIADASKRRKEDIIPLKHSTANELRTYLAGKSPNEPAFPMWEKRGAEMLRADYAVADIDYVDDKGEYADFHSLRGAFITNMDDVGIRPSVAKDLARHSDINLTLGLYRQTPLRNQQQELEKLPDFSIESLNRDGDQKDDADGVGEADDE